MNEIVCFLNHITTIPQNGYNLSRGKVDMRRLGDMSRLYNERSSYLRFTGKRFNVPTSQEK